MTRRTVGKMPPRYSFILNPYVDVRFSKCPKCDRSTSQRKFALPIHLDEWGPLVLGKTCRYCPRCELVIAHRNELEAELAHAMARLAPEAVGNEYLVVGTVDRKVWQGLRAGDDTRAAWLQHVADFERHLDLKVEGGWGRGPA